MITWSGSTRIDFAIGRATEKQMNIRTHKEQKNGGCPYYLLDELEKEGKLTQHGEIGQGVFYTSRGLIQFIYDMNS